MRLGAGYKCWRARGEGAVLFVLSHRWRIALRSVSVARALPSVGSVVGLAPSGVPIVRSLQGRPLGRWSFELQVKDEHSR